MSNDAPRGPGRLVDRVPVLSGAEMVEHLVPPLHFRAASLDSYRPDRDHPSQGSAVAAIRNFVSAGQKATRFFVRRKAGVEKSGIYLDGGFGVGKTHLLAALWHAHPGRKYYGTFIEYTALVGALGYANAVNVLNGASLICIDEFELDDPGDTRLMSRMLSTLALSGSRIAATSNTPPNALGEGRFAAQDFLREIDSLAAKFLTVRIDGLDYRRRSVDASARTSADVVGETASVHGPATLDTFEDILGHLGKVHPSRYVTLVEGLWAVGITGVHVLRNQADALRFVAFVDRLYDGQVRIIADGIPLDQVFDAEMLAGGYSKKYLRATSRLIALTSL